MSDPAYIADTWRSTGALHDVCQDHAGLAGQLEMCCGVVCDGCSTADESDVGSMLLARTALRFAHVFDAGAMTPVPWLSLVMHRVLDLGRDLRLDSVEGLTATLLLFRVFREAAGLTCKLGVYGDGVVIVRDAAGVTRIWQIDFPDNRPWYPLFAVVPQFQQAWAARNPDCLCRVSCTIVEPGDTTWEDGITVQREVPWVAGAPSGVEVPVDWSMVAIASDGLGSFVRTADNGVERLPLLAAAERFFSFRNLNPNFLKRRAKRALQELARDGVRPQDDISICVVQKLEQGRDEP